MKLEILAGIETKSPAAIRLTPIHAPFEIPDEAGRLLLSLLAYADWQDDHPGDGELDISLESGVAKGVLGRAASAIGPIGDGANVFVRIRRAG